MKKIDTTNIAGSAKAPFIKDTHDHYKEAIAEATSESVKGLLGGYTTNDLIVLWGCTVTVTGGAIPGTGTATLSAGAIYYNGEIYPVDANLALATTNPQTLIWSVATTYIASDSTLEWSDGVIRDLHQIDKLALSAGTTGSGLADYDGATVKYTGGIYRSSGGTESGHFLRTKVIEIGDWDMDTASGVSFAHGITFSKIRNLEAWIYNDSGTVLENLQGINQADDLPVGNAAATTTLISLYRKTGGLFDSVNYNATGYNRGFVTIQYSV
jgi:hypothetical protein